MPNRYQITWLKQNTKCLTDRTGMSISMSGYSFWGFQMASVPLQHSPLDQRVQELSGIEYMHLTTMDNTRTSIRQQKSHNFVDSDHNAPVLSAYIGTR